MLRLRHVLFAFTAILLLLTHIGLNYTHISAIAETSADVRLPILMYHKISEKPGSWGKYVISPDELEADIRLILARGFTPITISQLEAYIKGASPLPEKPIMLTFDDGNRSDFVYAFPLAQKYNVKMISSPVGIYTEDSSNSDDHNVNYAYLSWEEIREMQNSGLFEFQNHSYNLHNFDANRKGCLKSKSESESDYEALILHDFKTAQELFAKNGIKTPTCFTYPFGSTNSRLLEYIRELGFTSTLGTYESVNTIDGDLYDLYRFNRAHNLDIRKILNAAEKP